MHESAWQRAKRDSSVAFLGRIPLWITTIVLSGAGIVVAALFTWRPEHHAEWRRFLDVAAPAAGGILAPVLFLVAVFLFYLCVAPYRQRNEAWTGAAETSRAHATSLTTLGDEHKIAITELQRKLDTYEAKRPLFVRRTAHEGQWRRLVIANPNSFVVEGCYVAVARYQSSQPLNAADYQLPSEGFGFNWGTWQDNQNGNIGANDSLIIDIAEQRNIDYFTHCAPSDSKHMYTPALPLPYGGYTIDLVFGARSTSVPLGRAVVSIEFSPEQFILDVTASAQHRADSLD